MTKTLKIIAVPDQAKAGKKEHLDTLAARLDLIEEAKLVKKSKVLVTFNAPQAVFDALKAEFADMLILEIDAPLNHEPPGPSFTAGPAFGGGFAEPRRTPPLDDEDP